MAGDLKKSFYALIAVSALLAGIKITDGLPSSRHSAGSVRIHPETIIARATVWVDQNGNRRKDRDEPGLPKAHVYALAEGLSTDIARGTTDGSGRCQLEFKGLPGRYRLRIEAPPGYRLAETERGVVQDPQVICVDLDPEGVEIPLVRCVPPGLARLEWGARPLR